MMRTLLWQPVGSMVKLESGEVYRFKAFNIETNTARLVNSDGEIAVPLDTRAEMVSPPTREDFREGLLSSL